ncbi:MAG: site-specific DNA-methyltransferase [Actinomycetota bacterium]|nr:site-specific DNA-methyltransferase [Actinomycetota bacterium]
MTGKRRPTSTSEFGVGRRESHDSSAFYSRFALPEISSDDEVRVNPAHVLDRIYQGDSRNMTELADNSVALVVTSPPYFAGKEYEQALGEGHVPATYLDYLEMLEEVFAECARKLEPGGRMAINVANLGRRPYRSLAADITTILQDRLRLLLRGEIIWVKGQGASGSCAWGSFQSPSNPVLRDLTERVIVASKGRFDRALARRERARRDLPSEVSIFKDDFMEATTDVWEIPTESATRVNHPAPFPVELPERLIQLYTYRDDVVLDPFMGSGSTAVAAVRSERHFVGYDTDADYVVAARKRVEAEREALESAKRPPARRVSIPAVPKQASENEQYQSRAVREGQRAKEIALAVLRDCGFKEFEEDRRVRGGVEVNFSAKDKLGRRWFFDVSGAFTSTRAGLRRTDTLWKALGKASVLKASGLKNYRLVFLTTDLPGHSSAGGQALRAAHRFTFDDAIEMLSLEGQERLRAYADGADPAETLLLPKADGS